MNATTITAEERSALLRKYRLLAAWRRRRDRAEESVGPAATARGGDAVDGVDSTSARVGDSDPKLALKALAAEFPGALRELDVLGLPELLRRIARLERQGDEADEPWMLWIASYHALMRVALRLKRAPRHSGARAPDGDASAASAVIDESFASAVMSPPQGRIGIVVLRALAARFGVPAAEISRALFPQRRLPPYHL